MRSFFSLILICLCWGAFAQTPEDSVKLDFRRIRAGADAYGLIRSAVRPGITNLEVTGEIDLKKYIIAVDIGRSSEQIDSLPNYNYSNSGNYFRIGIENNFIWKDVDASVVFVGLRYGRAFFNEEIEFEYNDPILGNYTGFRANNEGMRARWLEGSVGMQAAIWRNMWMGYRASVKFGLKVEENGEFDTFHIPGFGPSKTPSDGNIWWGFQYYILIGIGH